MNMQSYMIFSDGRFCPKHYPSEEAALEATDGMRFRRAYVVRVSGLNTIREQQLARWRGFGTDSLRVFAFQTLYTAITEVRWGVNPEMEGGAE